MCSYPRLKMEARKTSIWELFTAYQFKCVHTSASKWTFLLDMGYYISAFKI